MIFCQTMATPETKESWCNLRNYVFLPTTGKVDIAKVGFVLRSTPVLKNKNVTRWQSSILFPALSNYPFLFPLTACQLWKMSTPGYSGLFHKTASDRRRHQPRYQPQNARSPKFLSYVSSDIKMQGCRRHPSVTVGKFKR